MSARERLEDLMIGIHGMPDEKVERMLDAYAHELAEKIRAGIGVSGQTLCAAERAHALRAAADLIDPEVPGGA